MARIIQASIDLSKIDKSRIKENNGKLWYQISIIENDEPDTYGKNVSIEQGMTKEENQAKAKKVYIGNGKTVWEGKSKAKTPEAKKPTNKPSEGSNENDLPF